MAAERIYGDVSSEGDTRSRRIWRLRTDGASCRTRPRIRNVACRVGASGCALHSGGRIVVRGMMISGGSSVCGGSAGHSTLRRMARVASSATFACKEVRIIGKKETKKGMLRYSDGAAWAISTNDAKEGLDRRVSRPEPRLLDASCALAEASGLGYLSYKKRTNARSNASCPSFQSWRMTER